MVDQLLKLDPNISQQGAQLLTMSRLLQGVAPHFAMSDELQRRCRGPQAPRRHIARPPLSPHSAAVHATSRHATPCVVTSASTRAPRLATARQRGPQPAFLQQQAQGGAHAQARVAQTGHALSGKPRRLQLPHTQETFADVEACGPGDMIF